MNKTVLIAFSVFFLNYEVLAAPKCLSGASLPYEQIISEKTGLDKALEVSQKMSLLDLNFMDAVCNSICNGNKDKFLDSIVAMMDQVKEVKGARDEKIKIFFSKYYNDAYCEAKLLTNGSKSCSHEGENFLRTAYIDRTESIVEQMVVVYGVDLNKKDEDDQMNTVEWLDTKCRDFGLLEADRKYFCNVLPTITCRAFKQLPKEQQKTPPKGCQI